jgi:hypothetical protein
MPETEHSQKNIGEMLTRLGNVEAMLRFSVGSSADSRRRVEDAFKEREGSIEVYLLFAEGPLSQTAVEDRSGYSKANVSKICKHLVRHGLVARDLSPMGVTWRWSDMEDILHVSRIATQLARAPKKAPARGSDQDLASVRID